MNDELQPLTPEERHALAIAPFRCEVIRPPHTSHHIGKRLASSTDQDDWGITFPNRLSVSPFPRRKP